MLNVRRRARSGCHDLVVATDFSAPALQARRLAARWFECARLTHLHAFLPHGSVPTSGPAANESWRAAVTRPCTLHLAGAALLAPVEAARPHVPAQGAPQNLLCRHRASADVAVVVLGSPRRSWLASAPLGSKAGNRLHTLDRDTPVVRGV